MFKLLVLLVVVAAAYGSVVQFASPLGAALLPRVNVAPTKVTVVKQPVTIEQTEAVYRSVPVPVRAVAYAAPVYAAHAYAAPSLALTHQSIIL